MDPEKEKKNKNNVDIQLSYLQNQIYENQMSVLSIGEILSMFVSEYFFFFFIR
jgi:hypothetical protein